MANWQQVQWPVAEWTETWTGGGEEGQLGLQGGVEQGTQGQVRHKQTPPRLIMNLKLYGD